MPTDVKPSPFSRYNFIVDLGDGLAGGFTEVSGLDAGIEAVQGRAARGLASAAPGSSKQGRVTLKRGMIGDSVRLRDWCAAARTGAPGRRKVVIRLLDERGRPVVAWTLANAWPVKITGPGLGADAAEAAIETLELAHEGVAMAPD